MKSAISIGVLGGALALTLQQTANAAPYIVPTSCNFTESLSGFNSAKAVELKFSRPRESNLTTGFGTVYHELNVYHSSNGTRTLAGVQRTYTNSTNPRCNDRLFVYHYNYGLPGIYFKSTYLNSDSPQTVSVYLKSFENGTWECSVSEPGSSWNPGYFYNGSIYADNGSAQTESTSTGRSGTSTYSHQYHSAKQVPWNGSFASPANWSTSTNYQGSAGTLSTSISGGIGGGSTSTQKIY